MRVAAKQRSGRHTRLDKIVVSCKNTLWQCDLVWDMEETLLNNCAQEEIPTAKEAVIANLTLAPHKL